MDFNLFSSPDKNNHRSINSRTPGSSVKKRNFRSLSRQQQLTSPQWFNNYRERCLNKWQIRNEERRANLFNRFRKISLENENDKKVSIQQTMNEVWIEMNCPIIDHDEMIQYYEEFLRPLEQELEEMDYWNPYENDQSEWEKVFDDRYQINCMICCRVIWTLEHRQKSTEIRCSNCGFQLKTRIILNEKQLFNRVDQLLNQHNFSTDNVKRCDEKLKFLPINGDDNFYQNIKLECNSCNFNELLL